MISSYQDDIHLFWKRAEALYIANTVVGGKEDQQYPQFLLYNKSDTPKRPENLKKYYNVLEELVKGCKLLEKNKCMFIVMPCNTGDFLY